MQIRRNIVRAGFGFKFFCTLNHEVLSLANFIIFKVILVVLTKALSMLKSNKKVILSVTNDLSAEQRVHKVANSLIKMGFSPLLLGIKRRYSSKLSIKNYETKRLSLIFHSGWLFYANYNIRLFFYLLFNKFDVFVANDLDTLPANYLVYRIKKIFGSKDLKLAYDSHELFTELPELNNRNFVKNVWLKFEKRILPNLKHTYTVCNSIAQYYNAKYNIKMEVIKNVPLCIRNENINHSLDFKLPDNKKIILYQGALNIGRGIESVINIMDRINDAVFIIAGKGEIEEKLHKLVETKQLQSKVIFTGLIPLEQLNNLTKQANIGLVLQEDISLSYRYVLPNRIFDFIKAGVPIIASNLPEISQIVENEEIGMLVNNFEEEILLDSINQLLYNSDLIKKFQNNIKKCSYKYCWEKQEEKLEKIYNFK